MVRGGGQRGGGGGKCQATTPVGGGVYKDVRRNIQSDDFSEDEDDQWTQVIRNKQRSPLQQSGSGSGSNQPNQPDAITIPSSGSNQPNQPDGSSGSGYGLINPNLPRTTLFVRRSCYRSS